MQEAAALDAFILLAGEGGRYGELPRLGERLVALNVRLGHARDAARARANLGTTLVHLGRVRDGLGLLQAATAELTALGDSEGAANALATAGVCWSALGQVARAIRAADQALEQFRAAGDGPGAAFATQVLVSIYVDAGSYERAIALLQGMKGAEPSAEDMGNLGIALYRSGDRRSGLELFERMVERFPAATRARERAWLLLHTAEIHWQDGNHGRAMSLLVEARNLADDDELTRGLCLERMADVVLSQGGPPASARAALEQALLIAERHGSTTLRASAERCLAEAYLAEGRKDEARRAAERAHAAVDLLAAGLADEGASLLFQGRADVHRVLTRVAVAIGDAKGIWDALERGRAHSLARNIGAAAHGNTPRSEGDEARDERTRVALVEAEAALDSVRSSGDRGAVDAAIRRRDAAAEDRQRALEAFESSRTDARSHSQFVTATVERLRQELEDGDVLVSYADLGDRLGALEVSRTDLRWVDLGPWGPVREALASARLRAGAPAEAETGLRRLRDVLWTPLGLPAGTRRVLVAPTGPLAFVPFAAFVVEDVEDGTPSSVVLVPSATVYALLRRDVGRRGDGTFAVGNPTLRSGARDASDEAHLGARRLPPLPEAEAEARDIAGTALIGSAATETAVVRETHGRGRRRTVHFACHGVLNEVEPSRSCLLLAPGDGEDGYWTAMEIAGLDLPSDLVTLSACDSGLGTAAGGEGALGLTRAFLCAGATRVLATLWRVDDRATRALMEAFYEARERPGVSTAAALRTAQRSVRGEPGSRWHHPRYWAGWVLWGLPD
jgi:tetratricopeptide (TPR) repeat protein